MYSHFQTGTLQSVGIKSFRHPMRQLSEARINGLSKAGRVTIKGFAISCPWPEVHVRRHHIHQPVKEAFVNRFEA